MSGEAEVVSPAQQLGMLLADCRKKAGLNQAQAAEQMGIAASTISLHEGGERLPELFRLEDYLELYDVSADARVRAVGLLAAIQRARAVARGVAASYHVSRAEGAA